MELKMLLPHLKASGPKGMATHVAWLARDFGRRDFAPFTSSDIEALSELLEPIQVEAGRKIFSPGQPSDAAYIVKEGEVELLLRRGGRRTLVGIQRAGGVVGDAPLLCEMPYPYTALARTEGTLLKLEKAALVELLARHPAIALRWLSSVVKRLEHANRRIVSLTVGDLRARTLALFAEELVGGNGRADVRFTQGEIAALLGATRQSVNRVLGHLANDGLVRQQYGAIEVLDGERILKLAGDGALAGGIC